MRRFSRSAIVLAGALVAGCGGGSNLPSGPVVNYPGGGGQPPTKLIDVKVTVTVSHGHRSRVRPDYVSLNTQSLAIALTSVNGHGVSGVNATVIDTVARAHGCKSQGDSIACSATAQGSPGQDVFAVTTYAAENATGAVLSVGTVQAKIAGGGGNVPISNTLSLTLDGVIATLAVALSPGGAKRGDPMKAAVTLDAFDASGAHIVGPSDYSIPIVVTIQGDGVSAFELHAGSHSGSTLTIVKPPSNLTMSYDGDPRASSVTLQATVDGPSIGAHAGFRLHGKEPPPPVGTIYALNLGSSDGRGATVTEYDGKATGNATPQRTLNLSSKLYARGLAVDTAGNLYVGYFDSEFGFSPSSGTPDGGNEIAVYAPGASGNTQPTAVLTADKSSKTTLFPLFVTFDAAGDLVTYGATAVDGNGGNDAVLTYAAGSAGAMAPLHGWNFGSTTIRYAGPTGLALDAAGDFYVNGALHTSLGPSYGLFVAAAADAGNPSAPAARTIPWDPTTELTPGVTTNVALDASGEPFVANSALHGSGSSTSCQGRANVFAAGSNGGITDVPPLRVLTLDGTYTSNPLCDSPRDPLAPYFPSIALYGTSLFVADDFNNAIAAYASNDRGTVKASLRIAGAATGLDAPIALVITSASGRATARPARPH
jgi:hypothetical protein